MVVVVVVVVVVRLKWSFGDWKSFCLPRFLLTRKHAKETKRTFSSKEQLWSGEQREIRVFLGEQKLEQVTF